MTVERMVQWFEQIQDKSNSVYFTPSEQVEFLNRAQYKFVNEYIFSFLYPSRRGLQGGVKVLTSIESTITGDQLISPLILSETPVASDANGLISNATIETAINGLTGNSEKLMHVLNLAKADLTSCSFVRHNDYYRFLANSFKAPSATNPLYRLSRNGLSLSPVGIESYLISLIKTPVDMLYDTVTPANNVDSELPDLTHDEIVAIALDDAGVSSRDQALIQLKGSSDRNLIDIN